MHEEFLQICAPWLNFVHIMSWRYIERREQLRRAFEKYYGTPSAIRLKRIALGVISAGIAALLAAVFFAGRLSAVAFHLIRIFAGLCALLFAAIVIIIVYRAHTSYWRDRNRPRK